MHWPRPEHWRTIPTRVGRTTQAMSGSAGSTDHPHARGENSRWSEFPAGLFGPSPRAWGERRRLKRIRRPDRTIPTRVGRTPLDSPTPDQYPDHPHARGENSEWRRTEPCLNGPSPRAWGEPSAAATEARTRRTIPTRVGRTQSAHALPALFPDHPHARGENQVLRSPNLKSSGPSPRAWGELQQVAHDFGRTRTIPTRVGRTCPQFVQRLSTPDHPHARGENVTRIDADGSVTGPSPRAWGEQHWRD